MKLFCSLIVFVLMAITTTKAQVPDWKVTESNYEYTMSLVSFINLNGVRLQQPNDQLGAFVNGVCRGSTRLTYVESQKAYYAYITIFSNTPGEIINFKVYDSANDKVVDVPQQLSFQINQHQGNLLQAYSIAQPALSKEAQISSFTFNGAVYSEITGTAVTVYIKKSEVLTAVTPSFSISSGADLLFSEEILISGSGSLDMTNPITLQLRSHDQTVLKNLTVKTAIAPDFRFFKRDAVCYEPGAVKITGEKSSSSFALSQNGVQVKSGSMTEGELIFDNLAPGNYQLTGPIETKEILIKEKLN